MIGKVFQNIRETPSLIDKSYRKDINIKEYILGGKGVLVTGGAG